MRGGRRAPVGGRCLAPGVGLRAVHGSTASPRRYPGILTLPRMFLATLQTTVYAGLYTLPMSYSTH